MRKMNLAWTFPITVVALYALAGGADPALKAAEFEKKFADGRRVTLKCEEIPYTPMTPAQKEAEKKRRGATDILEPAHLYRCALNLYWPADKGGEGRIELWSRNVGQLDKEHDDGNWRIQFLDVALFGESAVLLYKQGLQVEAEVVPSGGPTTLPAAADAVPHGNRDWVVRDFDFMRGEKMVRGYIVGSPAGGDLAVIVDDDSGRSVISRAVKDDKGYRWKMGERFRTAEGPAGN